METDNNKTDKAAGFISGILTGWGVPANWARVITGAILGAVAAYVTLTQTGCTATYNQTADGITFAGSIVLPTSK